MGSLPKSTDVASDVIENIVEGLKALKENDLKF